MPISSVVTPASTGALFVCMPGKNAAMSRETPKAPRSPMAEPMNASCAAVPYGTDEFALAGVTPAQLKAIG